MSPEFRQTASQALWEEIKMLDILEVAKEEGLKEGKDLSMLEAAREMVVDAIIEKFVSYANTMV